MTAPLPSRLRPNLIGIGAAKAGTTFLAGVLGRHPEIFMPPQKELNALYYNDIEARLDEYMEHFRDARDEKVLCDFSVRYISEQNAPPAARRYAPDARILAILRDPVDQVQSHYWHQRRQNFSQPQALTPAPDLFEALERFPKLLLEPSLYARNLARWREHFPAERFLLIDYAELSSDLSGVLGQICNFLEIAPFPETMFTEEPTRESRRGVAPRDGLLGKFYPIVYAAVTHGPYQALKRRLGVRRVEALKRRLKLREAAEAVFFKPGYPKLGDEDRRRLATVFAEDVASLIEAGFTPAAQWKKQ